MNEIDPSGKRIAVVAGDIGDRTTTQRLVQTAVDRFGGIDILINNAGIVKPTQFLEQSEADLDIYVNIILRRTFVASQATIPEMQRQGGGAIVNVGSMRVLEAIGAMRSSAYSAAKAGVRALTQNLAIEHAKERIRVNTIAQTLVETPVCETYLTLEQSGKVLHTFNVFHPLWRNGQQRDVTDPVLFLAEDKAAWIAGVVLPLDGGVTAGHHTH